MTRSFTGLVVIVAGSLLAMPAQPAAQATNAGRRTARGDGDGNRQGRFESGDRAVQETGDSRASASSPPRPCFDWPTAIRSWATHRPNRCTSVCCANSPIKRKWSRRPARAWGSQRTSGTGMVARQLWTSTNYSQVSIGSDRRRAAVAEGGGSDILIRDLTTAQITRLKVPTDPASGAVP